MDYIRLLLEGTAPASVIRLWEEDFNAGSEIDPEELRAWVLPRLDQVLALASPDAPPAQRHAAIFALGHAGDPRAVRALVGAQVAGRHRYDHDFVSMAFNHLGTVAVPALLAELPSRNALRTEVALSSLGHIEGVPLDLWREIGPAHAGYEALYVAVYNQHRADLASIARLGIDRPEVRDIALMALSECARLDIEEGSDWLAREAGLADQLAAGLDPLGHRASEDPGASAWSCAVEILSALQDPRAFDAASRALDDPDAHGGALHAAIQALGQLGTSAAKERLRALTRGKDPETQLLAAERLGPGDAEARQTALSLAAELRVDRPGWSAAIHLVGQLPDGVDVLASWVDPAKPRARRSRSAICGLADLAAFDPEILDRLSPPVRALVEPKVQRW